jgi:hypothetical protein
MLRFPVYFRRRDKWPLSLTATGKVAYSPPCSLRLQLGIHKQGLLFFLLVPYALLAFTYALCCDREKYCVDHKTQIWRYGRRHFTHHSILGGILIVYHYSS